MRYQADNCIDSIKFATVVSVMIAFLLNIPGSTFGQIVIPDDAPKPLSPMETGLATKIHRGSEPRDVFTLCEGT